MLPQFITVSTDHTGLQVFQLVLDEIIYIQKDASVKGVYLHTLDETGYLPGSLEYWLSFLVATGLSMEQYDRGTALNLAKVELLDRKLKMAYFEPVVRNKKKGCTIATLNFNSVVEALEQLNRSFKYI